MKRLLNLLDANTELLIRRDPEYDMLSIRGIKHVDDSNKVNVEVTLALHEAGRLYNEDMLWKYTYD